MEIDDPLIEWFVKFCLCSSEFAMCILRDVILDIGYWDAVAA